MGIVLIESDWNLKHEEVAEAILKVTVLIESDWNLKPFLPTRRRSRRFRY